jgi:FlaA1/EpsC-like NDP-sugar epimerase
MTIPEASQLILEAAAIGQGDEVFVLDMGDPIKIDYLARQMIRLAGKKPDEDVQVVYTALRPGEKLSEELFHDQENLTATGHDKILLARHREQDWVALDRGLQMLELACASHDDSALEMLLGELVPESVTSRRYATSAKVVPLGRAT